ncbi:MAG: TIGR04013 family B12-binding domain/radical SAM domain-containing protein [Myxococcaceae bacterium]|nr:TIGR04013 family B12-binding domain/radical SAM domain-containing protein [Myxococcaceae bacterium]
MEGPSPLTLVMSDRSPGRFAFTALIAALDAAPEPGLEVVTPRTPEQLLTEVRRAGATGGRLVVAWSFYSSSFPECAAELAWLRAEVPEIPFLAIAGGVHATAEPAQTLAAGFDLVCIGEGERALPELLRRLHLGAPLDGTPGFAAAQWRGPKPPEVGLDEFPPFSPARNRYGSIEITRGCLYACRFCQTPFFSKARFRHRSVESVASAVRALATSGRRDVRFISPTSLSYGSSDASVNLDAVEALLVAVREAAGPSGRIFFGTFPSEVRPEHVSPEALELLKRHVHNDNLIIGGQSGSERVLAHSRRGHGVEEIRRAVALCREHGFTPNVDFILGLPEESPDDAEATLALMESLADQGARVHGHTFMPLPGTPFREAAPGQVDPRFHARLDRLAARGRFYGQWRVQQTQAQGIADRRAPR